jgi:leader peptidase (prepilin peptidase)/N-methyltransferase
MSGWLTTHGASSGIRATIAFVSRAIASLGIDRASSIPALTFAGVAGGAAAIAATERIGSWWWLPALLLWAVTLSTAAVCDARTQRIPSALLHAGGSATALLAVIASIATGDWQALKVTLIACIAAGTVLAACWRFVGVGFGDVRLATIGGLGLGHTTDRALVLALLLFIAITLCQAAWTVARTGDSKTRFALGPALVAGFLVAAAA